MHPRVQEYCESVKSRHPDHFKDKKVLDVGSLDINGNNRYLFENCEYTGIDLGEGPNVDIICDISKDDYATKVGFPFDVVISTEMLEHCQFSYEALSNMASLVKSGGLLLITAAGEGRPEHGTTINDPGSAPYTNNWYKNIDSIDFALISKDFIEYEISYVPNDIRFYGIKK